MEPLAVYFIKVNIALIVLYTFYKLLFNNDTFFGLRRLMLLLICVVSFTYPLFDISTWINNIPEITIRQTVTTIYDKLLPGVVITPTTSNPASWIESSLLLFYVIGGTLLLLRTVLEILRIRLSLSHCQQTTYQNIKFYHSSDISEPCSFFHWIFLNPTLHSEKEINEILVHEYTHTRELHSVDIVIAQIVIILCWFNPFAWLIRREMRINHEFLADKQVVIAGYDKKTYQYHLLGIEHTSLAAANLYNNFNVLPLKKRIKMLNRKRTHYIMRYKYLMFIPVVALLLFFSNCAKKAEQPQSTTDSTNVVTSTSQPQETKVDTVTNATAVSNSNDQVYDLVEEMPVFPNGDIMSYLVKNTNYPDEATEKKLEGRVIIQFIITKDGSIDGVTVLRGVDPLLDKEAIRVVKSMPQWKPGKKDGKTVSVRFTVPVYFKLQ